MSLFDGIPDIIGPTVSEERREEVEQLRRNVNMRTVLFTLGSVWNAEKTCIRCPSLSHKGGQEKHPSVKVWDDHCYCFVCRKRWDIFGIVQEYRQCSFIEAVTWLSAHVVNPDNSYIPSIVQEDSSYQGPAPIEMVLYWHSCLTEDRRTWLREKRLLTDKTIDHNLIGWRPDWKAYSIPFWRGIPGDSLVDIVQFRSTSESWLRNGEPWHYIGYKGHNRPSLINQHRIGKSVVLLFGTLDALLAAQDGIAAISTNGATTFLRSGDNMERLKEMLSGSKVYLVPDKTESELGPAYSLAKELNAQVRHFPIDMPGKDYTDFRVAGGTITKFLTEVIMAGSAVIIEEQDNELFENILFNVRRGDTDAAWTFVLLIEEKYKTEIAAMRLNLLTEFDPFEEITHEQWDNLRTDIQNCHSYADMARWVYKACEFVHSNMGGF